MSSEVVGSASVVIRANTEGLSKDIENQINKSIGSINGKSIGSNLATKISTPFSKELSSSVTAGAKNAGSAVEKELTGKISNVGTAVSKAATDSKKGFDNISSSGKTSGDSLISAFKGVAAAAAIAFSFSQAKQFFSEVIGSGSALQKTLEANRILFGTSTAAVTKFAEGAAQSLGITEAQALEATRGFGSLLRGLQIAQAPAAKMSDTLVQLAGDISNFKGVDVTTVTNALQVGLTGNTRGLKQLGISIDANAIKQEALNEGLIKSGEKVTLAAKAQAVYALVLKQTTLEQGFFGKTSVDLANQQRILSAEWVNAKAALGTGLLPAAVATTSFLAKEFLPKVTTLARAIAGPLNIAFASVGKAFQVFVKVLSSSGGLIVIGLAINHTAAVLANLAPAFSKVGATALPVLAKLAVAVGPVLKSAVVLLLSEVNSLAEGWEKLVPLLGTKLVSAINFLVPGIKLVSELFAAFFGAETRFIDSLVNSIDQVFSSKDKLAGLAVEIGKFTGHQEDSSFVDGIANAFQRLADTLPNVSIPIGNFISVVGGGLKTTIVDATSLLVGYRDNGVNGLSDAFDKLTPKIIPITDALSRQKDVIIPLAAAISGFVATLLTISSVGAVLSSVSAVAGSLSTIVTGLTTAIEGIALGAAVTAALVVAAIAAVAAIFVIAFLKIKPFHDAVLSVVTILRDDAVRAFDRFTIGLTIIENKVSALEPIFISIGHSISDLISGIVNTITGIPDQVSALSDKVISGLQPLANWINDNLISTLKAAAGFFSALFARILDVVVPAAKVTLVELKLMAGFLTDVFGAAFKIAIPIIEAFGKLLSDVLKTAATVLVPLLKAEFRALEIIVRSVFNTIKVVIEGALEFIRGLFKIGEGILRGDFSKIFEGLEDIVKAPFHIIKGIISIALSGYVDLIKDVVPKIAEAAKALFLGIINAAVDLITSVPGILEAAFSAIVDLVKSIPERIATAAVGIYDALTGRGLGSAIKRFLTAAFDDGIKIIKAVPGFIATAAKDLFKGILVALIVLPVVIAIELLRFQIFLVKFVLSLPEKIATAAVDLFHGIKDAIVSIGGFIATEVPKVFDAIVGFVIDLPGNIADAAVGLWDGVTNATADLLEFIGNKEIAIGDAILGFITGLPDRISTASVGLWHGLIDVTSSAMDSVVGFIQGLPDRLATLVGNLADAGVSLGKAIIGGIVDGVTGAAGAFADFANGLANAVIGVVNNDIIDKINNFSITIPNPIGDDFHLDIPDSFKIPHIPNLATGGIALARPGGVTANLAEAGSNEAIIPLNNQGAGFLGTALELALRNISGGGNQSGATSLTGLNTTPLVGTMVVQGGDPVETSKQVVKRLDEVRRRPARR